MDSLEKRAAVAVTPGAQAPAAPRTRRELYSGSLDGIRSLLQGGKDLLTTAPRDRPEDGAAWQAWATVAEAWFDRVKHHKENATLPAHIRQRYDLPAGKIDEAKLLKGVPPGHQQRIYSVQVIVMALTGAEDGLDHWIITGHN